MYIQIEKAKRCLKLYQSGTLVLKVPIGLGRSPVGAKEKEGDGKTPEGCYHICLIKEHGKYGRSLGLSYPSAADARAAFDKGQIDAPTLRAIELAQAEGRRPPWGSALGGEIYIHEGGSERDWTQGCIALSEEDMDRLWPHREEITEVRIEK